LIGINGRISLEKRGRVNVGVGYAISINQIKNFMGHLKAGLDSDHASLGAAMESESEDTLSKILVKSVIDSDAMRRGLEPGDQLVFFSGRPMTSTNQFKNVLGLYPKGWRVPLTYRRENQRHEILVRLMGHQRQEIGGGDAPKQPGPPQPAPQLGGPAAKFYKAKQGFVNYYFNEEAQKAILDRLVKETDFTKKAGDCKFNLGGKIYTVNGLKDQKGLIGIREKGASDGKSPKVVADIDGIDYDCEPLTSGEKTEKLKDPAETGGLMVAMYHYRQLLVYGQKGFIGEFSHGGHEPFYPSVKDSKPNFLKMRVMCEVLVTKHAGVPGKWFFALEDDADGRWKKGQLIGFEIQIDKDEDPCEVCLTHYKDFGGNKLPSQIHVRRGSKKYADFVLESVEIK
jgi:serine protease Do